MCMSKNKQYCAKNKNNWTSNLKWEKKSSPSFTKKLNSQQNHIIVGVATPKPASWYTFSPLTSLVEHTQLHKSSYIIAKTKPWWSMYIYLKPLSLSQDSGFKDFRTDSGFQGFRSFGEKSSSLKTSTIPSSITSSSSSVTQLHIRLLW